MTLLVPAHCQGKEVHWSNAYATLPFKRNRLGAPIFTIELDGQKLEATINPASELTGIEPMIADRIFHLDADSPGVEVTEKKASDQKPYYKRQFRSLGSEGVKVINLEIYFRLSPPNACKKCLRTRDNGVVGFDEKWCQGPPPLVIGLNVLRRLRLYMASKDNLIYFTTSDAQ